MKRSTGGSILTHGTKENSTAISGVVTNTVEGKNGMVQEGVSSRGVSPIDQRPSIVDMRERFGDWEGDTLEGKQGSGGLATHVERKCRYLIAGKLPDKKAATMTQQSITSFRKTPRILRQTLTVDNGKEFSNFKELEKRTGLKVYFADPYAAWQRGTNENTNGLLRQYFPKGTDFRTISDKDVAIVVKKLNNRPRKCLNYQTPHEVFSQALRGALRSGIHLNDMIMLSYNNAYRD
jgi:IS30 family transposase